MGYVDYRLIINYETLRETNIMPTELRCDGMLYGILQDDGVHVEVKCKRRGCGAGKGIVVLHMVSLQTGKVTSTQRYAEPDVSKRGHGNGTR